MGKEETRKGQLALYELFLMAAGPIGFMYFLYLHITKNPLLEEIIKIRNLKISRGVHGAMATSWMIVCLLWLVILGCAVNAPEQSYSYVPPPSNGVPNYEIISIEDASIGKTVRTTVRVNYKAYTTVHGFYELVAKDVVKKITEKQEVNAIAIFFYNGPTAEHPYLGKVVWAPHGDWSEASNAVTGNYFWHKYSND